MWNARIRALAQRNYLEFVSVGDGFAISGPAAVQLKRVVEYDGRELAIYSFPTKVALYTDSLFFVFLLLEEFEDGNKYLSFKVSDLHLKCAVIGRFRIRTSVNGIQHSAQCVGIWGSQTVFGDVLMPWEDAEHPAITTLEMEMEMVEYKADHCLTSTASPMGYLLTNYYEEIRQLRFYLRLRWVVKKYKKNDCITSRCFGISEEDLVFCLILRPNGDLFDPEKMVCFLRILSSKHKKLEVAVQFSINGHGFGQISERQRESIDEGVYRFVDDAEQAGLTPYKLYLDDLPLLVDANIQFNLDFRDGLQMLNRLGPPPEYDLDPRTFANFQSHFI